MAEIVQLERERYQDYPLPFSYETDACYQVETRSEVDGMTLRLRKVALGRSMRKSFVDRLYQPYWENASAFGVFEAGELCGVIEVAAEDWSNRLRVTELLVFEKYRRKGYGTLLMEHAKKIAVHDGRRAILLETQSCNTNAIAFYTAQGFVFDGLDLCCYTNEDVGRDEVRLELAYFPSGLAGREERRRL